MVVASLMAGGVAVSVIYFIALCVSKKKQQMIQSAIDVVVRERSENVDWARAEAKKISDEERKKIEAMDFKTLQAALQSGDVTAESALRVYYGLAVAAHEKTNCLTNICKDALDIARALDEKGKTMEKKPRLFGMPISIKDVVMLKGHRQTWGMVKLIDNVATEDAYAVARLRDEGMVPFCQTNIPTTCMTYMTSNSIYGTTNSPLLPSRNCGGSSGGEGALIGSRGSLIGMGGDIGGSVRIPSSWSGCCGFKPSATRFTTLQIKEPIPMRPFIMPTDGPMAQDPHALVEIMRCIWSDDYLSKHDALSVPVNFREDLFKEGTAYRIGYYSTDGYIDPLPGNQRVIGEAAELLKKKGHTLVPFSINDIVAETARGVWGSVFADGGHRQTELLKDEPLSPLMEPLRKFGKLPMWVKRMLGRFARCKGDWTTAEFFLSMSKKSINVQKGIDRVFACRKNLVKKMKEENIDLILCPSTISPALPHDVPNNIPFTAIMATVMWNAMDFPAGVVTTSKWTEQDEADLANYDETAGMVQKAVKEACQGSVGLPLSVQIVAPAYRDEMVLRVMVDLHDAMKEGTAVAK